MNYEEASITFSEELPKWEAFIFREAVEIYHSIPWDQSADIEDIKQELRLALWKAIVRWRDGKGSTLSTWIRFILERNGKLLKQWRHRHSAKDKNGTIIVLTPLYQEMKDGVIRALEIEDTTNVEENVAETEWLEYNLECAKRVLSKEWEREVLAGIIETSRNDSEIAKELAINSAKVGMVRLKMKLTAALLNGWNIEQVTTDYASAYYLVPRIARRLRQRCNVSVNVQKLNLFCNLATRDVVWCLE